MGFNIDVRYPMEFDDDKNCFQYKNKDASYAEILQDKKYKDEANEIIAKVPVKDRHLFFK